MEKMDSERSLEVPQLPASSGDPRLRLHLREPDYSRPLLSVPPDAQTRIQALLDFLYEDEAEATYGEVERVMRVYYAHKTPEMIESDRAFRPFDRFTQEDVVAITYGDLFSHPTKRPLRTLANIVNVLLKGSINTVHILPFFPYSSDRGFSVVDFREVDSRMGSWDDIEELSLGFRLMFDGVINHVSSRSYWFREFLNGNPDYDDFFVAFSSKKAITEEQLRMILRPRTSDLLTPFRTINGEKFLWTTFSPDQVDLNYRNPKVLLRILSTLLYYVRRGADIIRLDAATYLWRELGTTSANLRQTHALVQLVRAVMDVVAPQVAILTETNVPHAENIAYFGDGRNEAHMVYNFALPPLALRAMRTGSCHRLLEWAADLKHISDTATYFNFLDSHDGIGLLGARDYLSDEDIQDMVARTKRNGGLVSYRTNQDGTQTPYELNITWYNALNRPGAGEPLSLQVDRFVASRSLALVLMGVPAIYLPSIGGSQFDLPPLNPGEEPRSINRRVIPEEVFYAKLVNRHSAAFQISNKFLRLIDTRIRNAAFHPNGPMMVLRGNDHVFSILRRSPDGKQTVLCLTNVSGDPQKFTFPQEQYGHRCTEWRDLITEGRHPSTPDKLQLTLDPYEILWLTPSYRC